MPYISIVTSLYRSENYLNEFLELCLKALTEIQCSDYEIIFVNDGSPDKSVEKLIAIKEHMEGIKVIDFSRNFGHHYAFMAGMAYANGEYVFNIDCDLEVSPNVLVEMYKEIRRGDYDVVYGYREQREGGRFDNLMSLSFWRIFNILSDIEVPCNVVTERLMTRKYVDALMKMTDKNLFLAGMMYWVGFNQKGIAIEKRRRKGMTAYTWIKRVTLMVEAVTSFSAYPLYLLFVSGFFITILSSCLGIYALTKKLLFPASILIGYTSLLIAIIFSMGVIIMTMGIIGLYMQKIYVQVKNRPLYIIKRIIE